MKIVHLTLKPYHFDSRIRKEVQSALALLPAAEVHVVAMSPDLPEREREPRSEIRRLRLRSIVPNRFGGHLFKYFEWLGKVRRVVRELGVDVLHIHGIRTLHAGVVLRRELGCRLVYDAHELETEASGMAGWRQPVAKLLEHRLMRSVDALLVVAPSILDWYRERRPAVPTELVRNVPTRATAAFEPDPARDYRARFGLSDDAIVFVLPGAMLPFRGIDSLLELFADRADDKHLVLMGYGPLMAQVEAAAATSDHIHAMPGVPADEVVTWVSSADLGVSMLEATCLNHECAMPNKFFEFLLAGIPALVSPRREMKRLVSAYDCGWVVEPESAGDWIDAVDIDAIRAKQPGVARARAALCWENDEPALLRSYGLPAADAPARDA